jgi:hypothetical protein
MRRNWRKIQLSLLRNSAPPAALTPDFGSLQIKGLTIALPGPQDTIDPDFAGIRSGLAALGIGYIGYSSNSFFGNMLPAKTDHVRPAGL